MRIHTPGQDKLADKNECNHGDNKGYAPTRDETVMRERDLPRSEEVGDCIAELLLLVDTDTRALPGRQILEGRMSIDRGGVLSPLLFVWLAGADMGGIPPVSTCRGLIDRKADSRSRREGGWVATIGSDAFSSPPHSPSSSSTA
ncbi:unnamed protein product [Dibothriocephalus latus]|uniref:Uncharacterized protein n=1 Tax=Dibothriocephalus latus TaxID=60516 RepID=A0A3P6RC28_DIBLA|nr:unnamed protein product [Dibothriocephalus latus]